MTWPIHFLKHKRWQVLHASIGRYWVLPTPLSVTVDICFIYTTIKLFTGGHIRKNKITDSCCTPAQVAVKFFLSHSAFQTEQALYSNQRLHKVLPPVDEICDNADGRIQDPTGKYGQCLWLQNAMTHFIYTLLQIFFFFSNENKLFLGWPNQHLGSKRITA